MSPPRAPGLLILLFAIGAAALVLLLRPGPAGAAERGSPGVWRWPLRGEIVQAFHYSRTRPFAAGARRGIDVAGSPGARVGAACAGRVTFAGRVPSFGRGVTVRCGAVVATHLGLGRVAVRRGAAVAAGDRLGALGAVGRLRLGARRAADRFGYVDPQALLGDAPAGGPPPVAPLGRAPRAPLTPAARPWVRVPARPVPRPRPVAAPGERVPAAPAPVPAAAWAGLVLVAAGLPLGGLVRRDRRRRRARRVLEPVRDRG
jgi:murein DD-endopeptidase MepM/ murein hydrolase activator NlpD